MKKKFNFVENVEITDGGGMRENYEYIRGIFPWRSKKKRKYFNDMGIGEKCASDFIENDGYLVISATYNEKTLEYHTNSNTGWKSRHNLFRLIILAICAIILGLGIWYAICNEEINKSIAGLGEKDTKIGEENIVKNIPNNNQNVRKFMNID